VILSLFLLDETLTYFEASHYLFERTANVSTTEEINAGVCSFGHEREVRGARLPVDFEV